MTSRRFACAFCLIVCVSLAGCGDRPDADVPPVQDSTVMATPIPIDSATWEGQVNDEQIAIALALAAWIPVYGEERIESEKPYTAVLKKGVWIVEGSMMPEHTVGGVVMARISQKDGRVLEIMHGE